MRKIKHIVAFGDSWTVGEGWGTPAQEEQEIQLFKHFKGKLDKHGQPLDMIKMRNSHSWVRWLANKYKVPYSCVAVCGGSNNQMFAHWDLMVSNNQISDDILYIFMWSSNLRERADFWPQMFDNGNNIIYWSKDRHLEENIEEIFTENTNSEFEKEFKKRWLVDVLDMDYFDHKVLNYKYVIQEYFKYYNIPLLQCNAFEPQPSKLFDKTFLKPESSMWDEMDKKANLWETEPQGPNYENRLHPNENGYKWIANYLKEYIDDNIL